MSYAKLSEFAKARLYSATTVREWVREGLPRIGAGKSLRIIVEEADRWITERAELEARERAIARLPVIVTEVLQ